MVPWEQFELVAYYVHAGLAHVQMPLFSKELETPMKCARGPRALSWPVHAHPCAAYHATTESCLVEMREYWSKICHRAIVMRLDGDASVMWHWAIDEFLTYQSR
jgi:hypothetical protein